MFFFRQPFILASVVQRMDYAIHLINHYPVDSVVCFVDTYQLDSDLTGEQCIHHLNNCAQFVCELWKLDGDYKKPKEFSCISEMRILLLGKTEEQTIKFTISNKNTYNKFYLDLLNKQMF